MNMELGEERGEEAAVPCRSLGLSSRLTRTGPWTALGVNLKPLHSQTPCSTFSLPSPPWEGPQGSPGPCPVPICFWPSYLPVTLLRGTIAHRELKGGAGDPYQYFVLFSAVHMRASFSPKKPILKSPGCSLHIVPQAIITSWTENGSDQGP